MFCALNLEMSSCTHKSQTRRSVRGCVCDRVGTTDTDLSIGSRHDRKVQPRRKHTVHRDVKLHVQFAGRGRVAARARGGDAADVEASQRSPVCTNKSRDSWSS